MAKKKVVASLFNEAYDVLLQKGANLTAAARRDLALANKGGLDQFGYDGAQLDAIDAAGTVVSEMPTDDEFVGILTEATAAKDALAEALRTQVAEIVARATTFYGADNGKVRRYGADKLSKMTDGQLWQCAKRTTRVATAQLADLAAKGLTPAHLTTLRADITAFDTTRDTQDDAIRERDIATQERLIAANTYYEKLLKLAADGQAHFESRDEARYNDYVWEPAPGAGSGGSEAPAGPVAGPQ